MSQQSQWIELYCQLGHHLSVVKSICLAESCSEFRFICDKCVEFENHKNHQLVNSQEAELYIQDQVQKYQELEDYLSSLCNSVTEPIKQLQAVIMAQHSVDLNLSQSNQKHKLLDNILKFDKKSDQIKKKIQNISNIYIEEIKKLIELVNVKNETIEINQSDEDNKIDTIYDNAQSSNQNNEKPSIQLTEEEKRSIHYYIQTGLISNSNFQLTYQKNKKSIKNRSLFISKLQIQTKKTQFVGEAQVIATDCQKNSQWQFHIMTKRWKLNQMISHHQLEKVNVQECLRIIYNQNLCMRGYCKWMKKIYYLLQDQVLQNYILGECLRHQELYKEAIQQYDLALEIDQKNVDSLFGKGLCLFELEQNTIPMDFDDSNQGEKQDVDFQTEDPSLISGIFQTRTSENPLYIQNNEDESNKSIQDQLDEKQTPNLTAPEPFDKNEVLEFCISGNLHQQSIADNLKKDRKYEEALKLYEKALEKYPNDIPSLNGKANCLRLMHKFPESLETLDKALKLNKNCLSLYGKGLIINIFIGECLRMQKKFKEADEYYQESLNKANGESQSDDPIFFMNLRGRGDILSAQGEYQKSIEFYDQALKLNQNHSLSLLGKAESLRCLGRYEDSIHYYNKSLDLNENDSMSLTGKGESLRLLTKYKEAQECYEKALNIDKNRIFCLRGLSNCLRKQGEPKQAQKVIERALIIDPNDENSLKLKGYLFQIYLLEICLKEIERKEKALKQKNNQ
ncbi:unnamed protein product (macronuclear) [Paramecium tetraurelia]|uniref:Tetratricopeptide repeat protein n=1 Tax=Paramecium tetraurelia TaxID=5888 RepID=A0BHV3_PARTE|nr:uncharacterized protein GSPATT00029156001 [Paramecium tetraurelia]CAK58120.1 unnamed protein product [Paramecium tetraurelia]|eukprot:XP_001425518.1 hypothetical protein (macronuclear) [Paramecium tetraurelia strain d4-2]